MKPKICITGGAGYVGSVLTNLLLKKKYDVTVLDSLIYGGDHITQYIGNKNFSFHKGDLRDENFFKTNIKKSDIIIHLAAIVGYPACSINPDLAREINVGCTKKLLKFISKDQIIFYASTGSNYGSIDGICSELTPLNPLTVYAKTKTQAEKLVSEHNNFLSYRFATAFGVSPRMRLDLLINDFVYKMISQSYLIVYEKHFMRTFIHIQDIARSFLFGIENFKKMKNEVYNVGNEKFNYSKEDICNIIKKNIPGFIHYAGIGEDMDKRNYVVSYEKIKKSGFNLKYSVEDGIDELIKCIPLLNTKPKYFNV